MHPPADHVSHASADARRATTARRGQVSIEREILHERVDALRRAGERLEDALGSWWLLVEVGAATAEQLQAALTDVADAAWSLVVQRECSGFQLDNHAWIRQHYDVPPEVWGRV